VSGRFPHARIIAVEMFRGPDHIAIRIGSSWHIDADSTSSALFASGTRFADRKLRCSR